MKKNKVLDIEDSKFRAFINEIYKSFSEDPYEFEYFCKLFFMKEGFDEVEVTKRSKDGGVDLKAIKRGYDNKGVDTISYKIQAKRLLPNTSVPINQVRELKGILEGHEKGVFITTGRYTKDTKKFVNDMNPQCIILIDGLTLVKRCLELDIGFLYKPVFNREILMKAINKYKDNQVEVGVVVSNSGMPKVYNVLKVISYNDIKTRILPIPKVILDQIPNEVNSFEVIFNNNEKMKLNINRARKFFSGVTKIFKKYKLIDDENNYISKESYWNINNQNKIINVTFRE